jgi:hypothetical protein
MRFSSLLFGVTLVLLFAVGTGIDASSVSGSERPLNPIHGFFAESASDSKSGLCRLAISDTKKLTVLDNQLLNGPRTLANSKKSDYATTQLVLGVAEALRTSPDVPTNVERADLVLIPYYERELKRIRAATSSTQLLPTGSRTTGASLITVNNYFVAECGSGVVPG